MGQWLEPWRTSKALADRNGAKGLQAERTRKAEAYDGEALVRLGYHESSLVLKKLGGSWGVWKASAESLDLIPGQ